MEQQNQQQNKINKLQINEFLSEEKLKNKLKKIKQFEKFQISVEFCKDFTKHFLIIKDFLNDKKDFKSLEINFIQIFDLVIEESLCLFKNIQQITNLSLSFDCMIHLSKIQQQTLSTCLLNFKNLEFLKLSFEFSKIFIDDKQLCLIEFYKNSLNLRSLDISVKYLKKQTYFLNLLLHGIRYLSGLQSLSFEIVYSNQQATYILDLLEEELCQNNNLTELSIDLGYQIIISNNFFHYVLHILNNLINLQKLDMSINCYNKGRIQQFQLLNTEIYKDFLPNLKKLKLKLDYISVSLSNLILSIFSKINNLEQVILDFLIDNQKQNTIQQDQEEKHNFQDLAEHICKFVNLVNLTLKFSYFCDLKFYEFINFIAQLNSLKKLNELKIDISNMKHFCEGDQLNVQQFIEVIKQLSIIHFRIQFDGTFFDNSFYPNMLTKSISISEKLEELYLDFYNFSSTQIKPQPMKLQDFTQNKYNLKDLKISFGNFLQIEESQLINLFSKLKQNKNLARLQLNFLSKISLSYESLEELSNNLIELKKLDQLQIQFQNEYTTFNDLGFQKLINTINNLNNLTFLVIQIIKDQFSKETIKNLQGIFENLQNLRSLTIKIIGKNFESEEEETDFGSSFKFPKKLETIVISIDINQVYWKNFENMFQKISQIKRVGFLFLNFKSLLMKKEESILFKQYLSKLKLLQSIYMTGYSFSMLHLVQLFQEIQSLNFIQFESSIKQYNFCTVQVVRKFLVINEQSNSQQLQSKSQNHPQKISLKIKNDCLLTDYDDQISQKENLFPFIFESLKFLTEFEFKISKNNQLGESNSLLIFKNLSSLQFLKKLNVEVQSKNQIGNESVKLFGQSLIQISCLKALSFVIYEEGNNLEWQNLYLFLECLGMLKQVKSISIQFIFQQKFQESIEQLQFACEICRQVANLQNLQNLTIILNNLTIQADFLIEFNNLCNKLSKNLRSLTLFFNQQQNETINQVCRSLLLLQNLQLISISQKSIIMNKLKRVVSIQKYYNQVYEFD